MADESKKKIKKKTSDSSGRAVDMQGLAEALSISVPTLRARLREGMPCLQQGGRGKPWEFDLAACIAWNTERAVNKAVGEVDNGLKKSELERLIMIEDLRIKRVAAAKALGEVAPLEEVERAITTAFVEVRQAMLALPDRSALRLLAAEDETAIKEVLEEEIHLALSALADADLLEELADAAC